MSIPTVLSNLFCLTPEEKWLKLWSVHWERGKKQGQWSFVSRKKTPMAVTGLIEPDAVVIVPTWTSSFEDRLVITKEYRIPLGGYYYGFPAGLIEKGQTPKETAIRELVEETGLTVLNIDKISPPVFSSAGMTDESSVLVYCTVTGTPSNAGQEEAEDIETLILGIDKLTDLHAQRGEFANARLSTKMWPILDAWLEKNSQ